MNDLRFPPEVILQASHRQNHKCACCGKSLSSLLKQGIAWHGHHVISVAAGLRHGFDPDFMRSVDNCVAICEDCHFEVAHFGNWNSWLALPTEFKHSHQSAVAHKTWAQSIDTRWGNIQKP